MADNSLSQVIEHTQDDLFWEHEIARLRHDVYCPMCEITHADNSNCQRND